MMKEKEKKQRNTSGRTLARECAFKYLYHLQLDDGQAKLAELMNESRESSFNERIMEEISIFIDSIDFKSLDQKNLKFAVGLIAGAISNFDKIKDEIQARITNWKIERVMKIDYTLLLLGIYELLYVKDTPCAVVINEHIELAKKYSSKESKSFINGILDKVANEKSK